MRMLVFVVLAVIWVIGGIIKARANKLKQEDEEQPVQPSQEKIAYPQPIAQKLAAKAQDIQLQPSTIHKAFKETQELASEPLEKLKDKPLGLWPEETAQPKTIIEEPLFDFDDPDGLRRAILHYEILGKPLSLRGPAG